MLLLAIALTAVVGYLLGSINFGIIVCKLLYGKDPRTMGSGNAGMTNVARSFGKTAAILTLLGDVAKGMLAVWVGRWLMMMMTPDTNTIYCAYIGGIAAIIGHTFPLYFHFKGGKGVASAGGAILAINPILALILVTIFLIIVLFAKMVSLASIIGISLYPLVTLLWTVFFTDFGMAEMVYSTVCAAFVAAMVVWMHRSNIERLRAGTENKVGQKKK